MTRIPAKKRSELLAMARRGNAVTAIARALRMSVAEVERELWKAAHPGERPPQRAPRYPFRNRPGATDPAPQQWRCGCGALASEAHCPNGHPAPWKEAA